MININEAMRQYLQGQRTKHVCNWEVFTSNPVGVAEHGDFIETLEKELEQIAKYDELLETLETLEKNNG